jgi:hypothetical protein
VSQDSLDDSNQHYVTRAHLEKFVHPTSGQAVLFPYRKGRGLLRPTGTRRLGSAMNFYRQVVNGTLSDQLDEARKASETLLFSSHKRAPSSVVRCINDDGFVPRHEDALELAAAAAFLFCGSPVQIHNTAMVALLASQMDLLNRMSNKTVREAYLHDYGDEADRRLAEDRERILDGDLFADVGSDHWKQLGFESFQNEGNLIRLLLDMNMTVVSPNPRLFFVTSDNPVVRIYPSQPDKTDDEMWFPISWSRAIWWHRRDIGLKSRLGYSETMAMNHRLIKHSYRRIYSPLAQDWVMEAVRNAVFNPVWGHYRSLRAVLDKSERAIDQDGKPHEIVDLVAALRSGEPVDVVASDQLR